MSGMLRDYRDAWVVTWREADGRNAEPHRDAEGAEAQAEYLRKEGYAAEVRRADVGNAVLDEMERVRTREGLVLADEQDPDGMGWPVWVMQYTDKEGDDYEWPAGNRSEADASAELLRKSGLGTLKGIFLFDAADAVYAEVGA